MSQNTTPLPYKKWTAEDIPNQSGRIMIVTGANSGLGYECALALAKKDAFVVMGCRNISKGKVAIEQIKNHHPEAKLDLIELDLASFDSIRKFADTFNSRYEKLNVLFNNAGIMHAPKTLTKNGLELHIGVNHFGHFLLTGLLLDKLKQTSGSRVVQHSSNLHRSGSINFDDINFESKYRRTKAYSQSKLANLLFAYELDRQFKIHNIDSIAVGAHPGYAATNLQITGPKMSSRLLTLPYRIGNLLFAQSAQKGALPLLYGGVGDEVEGGDYFGPEKRMRGYPKRDLSSAESYDQETAKRLWELSEKITGLHYEF